jgi:hypothetical protein
MSAVMRTPAARAGFDAGDHRLQLVPIAGAGLFHVVDFSRAPDALAMAISSSTASST